MANAYNSLWQVRNDSWCSLEEAAAQLALAGAQQRPVESLAETVPSLEDALMAARLNFRLQACVVRRRFSHRSRYDSSSLHQFADLIVADDLMEHTPDDRAQILARALARIRPELGLYLMTEISVEDLAGRLSHHFRRIFHTREGSLDLHLRLLDGVGARYRAPFFSALRSYSHRPTGVFHALPISHGKSIVESHWIRGHDRLLRPGHLPGRDLRHLRRPRLPARAHRAAARGTAAGRQDVRVAADLLRHQRHLDRQQDRGPGPGPAGGHRPGRPELPPVPPLRG